MGEQPLQLLMEKHFRKFFHILKDLSIPNEQKDVYNDDSLKLLTGEDRYLNTNNNKKEQKMSALT